MKRISKKIWLIICSLVISVSFVIAIVVIKLSSPFKPAFYIYSSYMDQKTKTQISQKYNYREYGSFEEFEYAIGNNKAIAGVTSDYSIVNLIKEDKIAPISKDLANILGIDVENIWNYFTPVVNQQLAFFDKLIDDEKTQQMLDRKYQDQYGKGYLYKFRDFVIPYFINDKVIAFDTKKILNKTYNVGEEIDPLKLQNINPDISKILETLKSHNSKFKIQWTKNPIENVVYGSSYNSKGEYEENNFSTKIDDTNYVNWINNFNSMVKLSTNGSISNDSINIFSSDSDIILNNLINPSSKINVAVLYNGDALDAYYGHDNFNSIQDGDRLRILRSSNTVKVLDAFVINSSINSNSRKELLKFFNEYVFNNMFKNKDELKELSKTENIYETNGIMRIFDYVNYTPAAKGAYEYIKENYFDNDQVAIDIFSIDELTPGKAIYPINKQLLSKLNLEFQKKLNGK